MTIVSTAATTRADIQHKACESCARRKPHAAILPCTGSPDALTARYRTYVFASARRDCEARERRAAERIGGAV